MGNGRRIFEFNRKLLPNKYIAEKDRGHANLKEARRAVGYTIGYPAWCLLYYSLMCGLPYEPYTGKANVIETGTNHGSSTIIMAQCLKDRGYDSKVHTVDIKPEVAAIAAENFKNSGVGDYIKPYVCDSLEFLTNYVKTVDEIHFAFLDSAHIREHVLAEFDIIYEKVKKCNGKVYFDNTIRAGVWDALSDIKKKYGGNMIEFRNCSSGPPGNVIWQPDWYTERPQFNIDQDKLKEN